MGHLVVEPLIAADDADIGLDAEGPRAVGGFDRTGIGAGVLRERGGGDEDGRAGERPEQLAHVGIPRAVPVDRKSVVSGKSVSVGGELGGCRIMKKQKPNIIIKYYLSIKQ